MTINQVEGTNEVRDENDLMEYVPSDDDTAGMSMEFQMPPEEAFLLTEIYIMDKAPLWVSPEELSEHIGVSREQALDEMNHFCRVYGSHVEWKVGSNGQVFLKVRPSYRSSVEESATEWRLRHPVREVRRTFVIRKFPDSDGVVTQKCNCGHGKSDHDFDDGGHCKKCNCYRYVPRGGGP
jgi:hypothetical protein